MKNINKRIVFFLSIQLTQSKSIYKINFKILQYIILLKYKSIRILNNL